MRNPYQNPQSAMTITPSSAAFANPLLIYVGSAGSLEVLPAVGASSMTFTKMASGSWLPLKVIKVLSGSTATQLIGCF